MKAVIIPGQGFEDSEAIYPYYRLQEAGFTVEVATKKKETVTGKHGVKMLATVDATTLDGNDYELVVIPGGHEGPDRVRQIPEVLEFLKEMNKQKKIIAAVCHGPWVLVSAGIIRGRRITCYPGCKDDIINAGAKYIEEEVVVDENIITCPHYKPMAKWMRAIVEKFA